MKTKISGISNDISMTDEVDDPTKRSKVILIWRAVIQQRSSGFLS